MDKSLKSKAISIKGKDYVQVKDRVLYLAETYQDKYSIVTEYEFHQEKLMWVVKATLTINGCTYTGLAQEIESDDYKQVNHASALENCETSAVGRACAMAGIGVLDSIASADEMTKASNRKPIEDKFDYQTETHGYRTGKKDGRDWFAKIDLKTKQYTWLTKENYLKEIEDSLNLITPMTHKEIENNLPF